jgi:phage tail-like protein
MASFITNLLTPNNTPFTAFNFLVEIQVDGVSDNVCGAGFSECDGLEMNITPKTIREGGRNSGPVHLLGPVGYGQLTLKRGMTPNFDLWRWFEKVASPGNGGVRGTAQVVMLAGDGSTEQARFTLTGCLPVKLKSASLNAGSGAIAIEEMQIAYETMTLEGSGDAGLSLGIGISAGASIGVSASASIGGFFSASASIGGSVGF